ncbi:MAG: hypothetical protein ACD_22C00088G0005 [uncultured bacterium]|nr:MAG: hypothetical protein ACD_22C00088G0005 [uncultured bacterium]
MKYQITSDNIQISESMKVLAEEKLAKIDGRFTNIPEESKSVRVVLNTSPNDCFEVKIELTVDGHNFFTDETEHTLETALVNAVEELERQIDKSKYWEKDWEEQRESKRFPADDPDAAL